MKELTRRLLVYESGSSGERVSAKNSASFRVCEKLRVQLAELIGVGGFRALLARAKALAGTEVPWLRELQIMADGSLEGLHELEAKFDSLSVTEGEVVLVSQLLELLVTFIGPALTLRLLHDIWPKMEKFKFLP
jgi:nicotinic acid phosphoribosyltransferase